MEILNKKRKIMENARRNYAMSNKHFLSDCYKNPSYEKILAYDNCLEKFENFDGEGFKIIGYNCNCFSVGFYGKYENKKAFFYITKDYERVCILDE